MEIQDGRYFCRIILVDTFNLICYLPWFLSVITKRDNFRTRSSDDVGTLTKRHFSQLLPGYQTATLPGYYVYQLALYERSEEKLRGHATHTEPPSDTGLIAKFRSFRWNHNVTLMLGNHSGGHQKK